MNAHQIVEAVLFAADAPLTAEEIARADETLDEDAVEASLQFLRAEYDDAGRAFQLTDLAEGHQILTRPEFAPYLERFDNVPRPSRLSGPALETLAIIAYRQPLGRVEIEYIRGVGASGVIKTLQDRQLIDVVGRAEGLGRPLLYGTTKQFLEHFGFRSLEDLPRPEELPVVLRERVPLGIEDDDEVEESGQEEIFPADGEGPGDASAENSEEGDKEDEWDAAEEFDEAEESDDRGEFDEAEVADTDGADDTDVAESDDAESDAEAAESGTAADPSSEASPLDHRVESPDR